MYSRSRGMTPQCRSTVATKTTSKCPHNYEANERLRPAPFIYERRGNVKYYSYRDENMQECPCLTRRPWLVTGRTRTPKVNNYTNNALCKYQECDDESVLHRLRGRMMQSSICIRPTNFLQWPTLESVELRHDGHGHHSEANDLEV